MNIGADYLIRVNEAYSEIPKAGLCFQLRG